MGTSSEGGNTNQSCQLAVFGLGKLGLTLAGVLAEAGHSVRGYDVAKEAVEALRNLSPKTFEPGLEELLSVSSPRLQACFSADDALAEADGVFIIVPTPSRLDGSFDNSFLLSALAEVGEHLRKFPRVFNVVIASTVMPGSCVQEFIPQLETSSGLRVGEQIGLVYSPEFIALGSIIKDMKFPDLALVGESNSKAGDWASSISLSVAKNTPEIRRMGLTSAELAKIAINTFVTTKISFANMLGEICDRLDGADIDDVTGAVGADSRVGHRYLRAALGYGGPCFPRDNAALAAAANKVGVSADIAKATDQINVRQVERLVDSVMNHLGEGEKVMIVGLAYKDDTPVTEASQSVDVGNALVAQGVGVIGVDPHVARDAATPNNEIRFPIYPDTAQGLDARVIVLSNPGLSHLITPPSVKGNQRIILDLWGALRNMDSEVLRPGKNT